MVSVTPDNPGSSRRPWWAAASLIVLVLSWLAWHSRALPPEPEAPTPPPRAKPAEPAPDPPDLPPQPSVAIRRETPQPRAVGSPEPAPAVATPTEVVQPWSLGWNDTVPERFRPTAFEANVRAAVAACDPPNLSLVAVDCTGAPCYAVFRGERDGTRQTGDNELMQAFSSDCPAWKDNYEDAVYGLTRHSTSFTCPDGSREWIVLFGSELVLPYLGVDSQEREQVVKDDAETRVKKWRAGWRCSP